MNRVSLAWLQCALLASLLAMPQLSAATNSSLPPTEDGQARTALKDISDWLLAEHDGVGGVLPNGARRSVKLYIDSPGSSVEELYDTGLNNQAACQSLEFLTRYSQYVASTDVVGGHSERYYVRLGIRRLVDLILLLRSEASGKIQYHAIGEGVSASRYNVLPNSVCGRALLLASTYMAEPSWKVAAIDIANFLLRLQNPDSYYSDSGRYGADFVNRSTHDGIFDLVQLVEEKPAMIFRDRLDATMSTWNLSAAPFLMQIFNETGIIGYKYGAIKIVRLLSYGALNGYDYFAVDGFPEPDAPANECVFLSAGERGKWVTSLRTLAYNTQCPGDGRWHRQGEVVVQPGQVATSGTDGAEYGLAALLEYSQLYPTGFDEGKILDAYKYLRSMPNAATSYDMGLSFSGYFRMNCDPFPEIGYPPCGANSANINYGSYYDIVGAGILSELKRHFAPQDNVVATDSANALLALLKGRATGTATNPLPALDPKWSTDSNGHQTRTEGILPMTVNGTALMKRMFE